MIKKILSQWFEPTSTMLKMSNLMEYMIQIADQIRELQEDADGKMEVILKEIALIQIKLHELDEKINK